ncbi:MAG: hypothetical protein U0871_25325 [Gemmataceae bacterium]
MTGNLFPLHTDWTDAECWYVTAHHGFRQALLAGPFPTRADAESALPAARGWAVRSSGDPAAATYRYAAQRMHTGHARSILGPWPAARAAGR